ncbi:MAG: hypothetical protein GY940_17555 [bacterium]|nr:hypothetical protein [bacterium]
MKEVRDNISWPVPFLNRPPEIAGRVKTRSGKAIPDVTLIFSRPKPAPNTHAAAPPGDGQYTQNK